MQVSTLISAMNISQDCNVTDVIATPETLYLLTVFDALNVILWLTLVSFFYEISMGTFWSLNLDFPTFQDLYIGSTGADHHRSPKYAWLDGVITGWVTTWV